jgi:hypothetical protein
MKYLEGGLDVSEHDAFLNQLSVDAELTKELCLHQEVDSVLSDPGLMTFSKSIRDVYRNYLVDDGSASSDDEKRNFRLPLFTGWRAILSMVAVICIVLATFLVYRFVDQKPFHEQVFSQFYQPYALDLVSRSGSSGADPFLEAVDSYNSGDFSKALLAFDAMQPDQNLAKDHLLLLQGICYLELDQPGLAVESFHNILVKENIAFATHAKWYLSLSYLKLNEIDKTRLWLREIINNEPYYTRDATRLLRKLN